VFLSIKNLRFVYFLSDHVASILYIENPYPAGHPLPSFPYQPTEVREHKSEAVGLRSRKITQKRPNIQTEKQNCAEPEGELSHSAAAQQPREDTSQA
jgi:hypothetical protein